MPLTVEEVAALVNDFKSAGGAPRRFPCRVTRPMTEGEFAEAQLNLEARAGEISRLRQELEKNVRQLNSQLKTAKLEAHRALARLCDGVVSVEMDCIAITRPDGQQDWYRAETHEYVETTAPRR